MNTRIKVLLAFALLLLAGCEEKNDSRELGSASQDVNQRRQIVYDSIAAGDELAARVQNPAVFQIMEFLKTAFYFVAPRYNDSNKISFEQVDQPPAVAYTIGITALTKKDRGLGGFWKDAFDSESHAFLFVSEEMPNMSLLILKDYPVSRTWNAVKLVHEASHAIIHALGTFEDINDQDVRNAYYELETYVLQGEILAALGGDQYARVLEKEIVRVGKKLEKKEVMSPDYDLYAEELKEAFGEPESRKEVEQRMDSRWLDAALKLYERKFSKEEAIQQKVVFMMSVHKKRNFFKK